MKKVAVIAGVAFAALAAPLAAQQKKEVVNQPGATANPNAVLSNAIKLGNTIWVSGQTGTVRGDSASTIEKETTAALDKIKASLEAGGFSMGDVVSVQVYLTDIEEFQKMNGVYRTYFPDMKPTRTTVQVAKLVGTAKIEITATAAKAQ
jgi:2-iminobutanoate/2-iminopropanoate deaminase